MHQPVISGTGVFTPEESISNDELVVAFNAYADLVNVKNADAIATGDMAEIPHSSSEFIFKASGIERRFVMNKSGILDPTRMYPALRQRSDEEPGIMAEMAVDACKKALAQA
ncbi:MAG: beta-ketoacyl-ACP synthase III, partial [Rhodobacteraceae bacterium]|nr:beta-ketoacyl-ACP synthase III [Paracoccaceae bacterium]